MNETPTPKSKGNAITFAKFNGNGSTTHTSTVNNDDNTNGANTSNTSTTRRNANAKITTIATIAPPAARVNAEMIVSAVDVIVTALPPASGATRRTWSTNRRNPSAPLVSATAFAETCTRSRPSGSTQSRANAAGTSASVTARAVNASRNRSSCNGRNRVNAAFAAISTPSGAASNAVTSAATARNGWSAGNVANAAVSCDPAACAANRKSPGVTGAGASRGANVAASNDAASAINGNFTAWSSGTRLSMETTCPTNGNAPTDFTSARASAAFRAMISIV